jgi:predicted metal-binding membrane protein
MAVRQDPTKQAATQDRWLAPALLLLAALGWWWSAVTADDMDADMSMGMDMDMDMAGTAAMSLGAFLVAWVAMMGAMMLPAVLPVVRLYARAAARGTVAPVAVFLAGYAAVWSAMGLPVYFLWRRLDEPLAEGTETVGRVAGAVLVAAAVYQLSPLKSVCLRHCRSPMSFFMQHSANLQRPTGALRVGAHHGLYCLGCCWMLMAVLIALGTMELRWMAVVAAIILLEKVTPIGERVAVVVGIAFLVAGVYLILDPSTIADLT